MCLLDTVVCLDYNKVNMNILSRSFNVSKRTYNLGFSNLRFENLSTTNHAHGTHDYKQVDYAFPQHQLEFVVENNRDILKIRQKTNTVIRLDEKAELSEESGETMHKFLVVGSTYQRKIAFDLLNSFMNGKDVSKIKVSKDNSEKLIWHSYKRNFKGQFAPLKPRKKCIRCGGKMLSGNPCPICQLKLSSNYNVHFTDIEILNQFICPYTWNILDPYKTNICREQHRIIEKAIIKARKYGLIPFTLPLPSDEPKKFVMAGVPTDRNIKVKIH